MIRLGLGLAYLLVLFQVRLCYGLIVCHLHTPLQGFDAIVSLRDDLLHAQANQTVKAATTQTFLSRPWKAYSLVVFMEVESYIGGVVRPEGWLAWDKNQTTLTTLYYAKYMNTGSTLASAAG
uniref:Pectinesterase n=1 Tax=Aegilops tauschii TaxID=37682 RepID=M8C439_AEGTA